MRTAITALALVAASAAALPLRAQAPLSPAAEGPPRAFIDGSGPGWRSLAGDDFADVNGDADTWVWQGDFVSGSGEPIGVSCTRETIRNFELVAEWRHLQEGGNSGIFAWVPDEVLAGLPPGELPKGGIEIQMLDHGYREQYERSSGRRGDWFTTNGDVFAVGGSKLSPFPPLSPDGSRSFPRAERSRGAGEWNHYYVRGINGEIRLWVNGEEVSGGSDAEPAEGRLCLEAEGAPVELRRIRLRRLP